MCRIAGRWYNSESSRWICLKGILFLFYVYTCRLNLKVQSGPILIKPAQNWTFFPKQLTNCCIQKRARWIVWIGKKLYMTKGTALDRALQTATRSPILLPELRLLPRAVAAMEVPSSLWPRDPIAWARRQGGEEDFFFKSKEKRIWWGCIDASAEQDLLEGYSTCRSPSHQTAKPCSDSI